MSYALRTRSQVKELLSLTSTDIAKEIEKLKSFNTTLFAELESKTQNSQKNTKTLKFVMYFIKHAMHGFTHNQTLNFKKMR